MQPGFNPWHVPFLLLCIFRRNLPIAVGAGGPPPPTSRDVIQQGGRAGQSVVRLTPADPPQMLRLSYNDEIVRQRGRVGPMRRRRYHASVDGQRRGTAAQVERAGTVGAVAGDVTAGGATAQIQRRLRVVHRRDGQRRGRRRTSGRGRRAGQAVSDNPRAAVAFDREINREGRDGGGSGMVLLLATIIGRYHNERWCCGMSVYEGFVWKDPPCGEIEKNAR